MCHAVKDGIHRPAIVVRVKDPFSGECLLSVMDVTSTGKTVKHISMTAEFNSDAKEGTWHWIEPA